MLTKKKLSEDKGFPQLVVFAIMLPLIGMIATFSDARIAFVNFGRSQPREVTIAELSEGKIPENAWVKVKGCRWNDHYVRETDTSTNKKTGEFHSYSSGHWLLISPDDPQLKKWQDVKKTLEEFSQTLKKYRSRELQDTPATSNNADEDLGKMAPRLIAAGEGIKQFHPTLYIGSSIGAAPDANNSEGREYSPPVSDWSGSLDPAADAEAKFNAQLNQAEGEINKAATMVQDETTLTGLVSPVGPGIQQQFAQSGYTPPKIELASGEPYQAELYKFLGAALILVLEGLFAWLMFLRWKQKQNRFNTQNE